MIPGLLTAAALLLCAILSVRVRPELGPRTREKVASLGNVWPAAVLAVFVIGSIYTGTVSPSAADRLGGLFVSVVRSAAETETVRIASANQQRRVAALAALKTEG